MFQETSWRKKEGFWVFSVNMSLKPLKTNEQITVLDYTYTRSIAASPQRLGISPESEFLWLVRKIDVPFRSSMEDRVGSIQEGVGCPDQHHIHIHWMERATPHRPSMWLLVLDLPSHGPLERMRVTCPSISGQHLWLCSTRLCSRWGRFPWWTWMKLHRWHRSHVGSII